MPTTLATSIRAATLATTVIVFSTGAFAQKSADTMRVAVGTALSHISLYTHPNPELSPFYREVHDSLIRFNEQKRRFEPLLAKSWKYADDGAMVFELRDDVTFHDGKKLTSDDVVTTINWAIDPTTKIFNQNRFTSWIKAVEKTGPLSLRINVHKPTAVNANYLNSLHILNGDILSKLDNKGDYGARPVGTGPMKVVAIQQGQSVTLERFDAYKAAASGPTRRVVGRFIPDDQTQMAQLLVGELDVVRDPPADLLREVPQQRKNIKATIVPSINSLYLQFDATNRSGAAKPLTDVRVRRAIAMAVDRRSMASQFGAGLEKTRAPDSVCLPEMVGCKVTAKPPAYDPAAAKKQLAEAGYPNGFEIEIVTVPAGRAAATAVSGYLQAVGIKASINQITVTAERSHRPSGKSPLHISTFPGQALGDAHVYTFLFLERDVMDYARDAIVTKAGQDGLFELDTAKREKIYEQMFNRINEQAYMLALMTLDIAYLHSADVVVAPGRAGNAWSARLQDYSWVK